MEGSASAPIDECPRCGRSLEVGYVIPGRGLAWSPLDARHVMPADATWLSKPWRLGYANFPARRCPACRLVLFEYPPEGDPLPQ